MNANRNGQCFTQLKPCERERRIINENYMHDNIRKAQKQGWKFGAFLHVACLYQL